MKRKTINDLEETAIKDGRYKEQKIDYYQIIVIIFII